MHRSSLEDTLDLIISFVILSVNLFMLFIMLTSNISFGSISLWEVAINRGLLCGNITLAFLSFYWVFLKRTKFERIIEKLKKQLERKN